MTSPQRQIADGYKAFGDRLKGWRKKAGLKQEALADEVGVSRTGRNPGGAVATWERGLGVTKLRDVHLSKIDKACGLPSGTAFESWCELVMDQQLPAGVDDAVRKRLATGTATSDEQRSWEPSAVYRLRALVDAEARRVGIEEEEAAEHLGVGVDRLFHCDRRVLASNPHGGLMLLVRAAPYLDSGALEAIVRSLSESVLAACLAQGIDTLNPGSDRPHALREKGSITATHFVLTAEQLRGLGMRDGAEPKKWPALRKLLQTGAVQRALANREPPSEADALDGPRRRRVQYRVGATYRHEYRLEQGGGWLYLLQYLNNGGAWVALRRIEQ